MLKQDQLDEIERIERRNERIKKLLADGDAKTAAALAVGAVQGDSGREVPAPTEKVDRPRSSYDRPSTADEISVAYGQRRPKPWEDARGRQVRPMTMAEQEEEQNRVFLKNQWNQDQIHAAAVKAAERERDAEQRDMDKRRAHEKATNRRPYGEKRFIPLEQAIREGYVGQASSGNNNGRPEWWSEKNPTGLMCIS